MSKPISQQIVVVTGASSGVGRAIAQGFGVRGAKVALIARSEEALEGAARDIREAGGEAMVLPLDVANSDAVYDAAGKVEERWGAIDTWVNDAMVTVFSPAMEMTMDEYRRVTEVNYLGYVYGTLAALHRMWDRNEGTIIQVSSALAFRAIPLQTAYCGSKGAIHAFTDGLRTEIMHAGKNGIHLTELILPAVNTPQFDHSRSRMPNKAMPVPPIYQPEVIARAALQAAEHRTREMVIGWGALKAVLGQMVAPGLLDHYLARKGVQAQLTPEPYEPRPDNLYAPVAGDPGAHGRFDSKARGWSAQLWLDLHKGAVLAAAGLASASAMAALRDRDSLTGAAKAVLGRAVAKKAAQHPRGASSGAKGLLRLGAAKKAAEGGLPRVLEAVRLPAAIRR